MSEVPVPRSREHVELHKLTKQSGEEPTQLPESLNYGTHTLPKKFWTRAGHEPLRSDPDYRRRREAKRIRHEQNKANRAEENRRGGRR